MNYYKEKSDAKEKIGKKMELKMKRRLVKRPSYGSSCGTQDGEVFLYYSLISFHFKHNWQVDNFSAFPRKRRKQASKIKLTLQEEKNVTISP